MIFLSWQIVVCTPTIWIYFCNETVQSCQQDERRKGQPCQRFNTHFSNCSQWASFCVCKLLGCLWVRLPFTSLSEHQNHASLQLCKVYRKVSWILFAVSTLCLSIVEQKWNPENSWNGKSPKKVITSRRRDMFSTKKDYELPGTVKSNHTMMIGSQDTSLERPRWITFYHILYPERSCRWPTSNSRPGSFFVVWRTQFLPESPQLNYLPGVWPYSWNLHASWASMKAHLFRNKSTFVAKVATVSSQKDGTAPNWLQAQQKITEWIWGSLSPKGTHLSVVKTIVSERWVVQACAEKGFGVITQENVLPKGSCGLFSSCLQSQAALPSFTGGGVGLVFPMLLIQEQSERQKDKKKMRLFQIVHRLTVTHYTKF